MVLHHYSVEFATSHSDFKIANSKANAYCINNHFYYVPHQHGQHFDWIYLAEGQLKQTVNGQTLTLEPGDLLWIRPGDWHEEQGSNLHFFVLYGTTTWLESVMAMMQTVPAYRAFHSLTDPPRVKVPENQQPGLLQKFERAWQSQPGSLGPSHAVKLACELFVDCFLPMVEHVMQHRQYPDWIRKAMSYIQNNVGQPITTRQLSGICNKSPEHVVRCFHNYLGTTPSRYINFTRLNYAARLLTTTNRSILDIALTAGFGSQGHFYRLFKNQFNRSPRVYRLEMQNNQTT